MSKDDDVGKPPNFGQPGGDMFVGSLSFEILP